MRWCLLCLALTGALGAQAPIRVVAVERRGLPPYEPADRIYRLDAGKARGLRVGDRLMVKRKGEPLALGHLQVIEVQADHTDARFDPVSSAYPMVGDLALLIELTWMPAGPVVDPEPLPVPAAPLRSAMAPPREGLLYFLPQRADLSPAGQKKVEAWVESWGRGGWWAVQVPTAKGVNAVLQQQRVDALLAALRACGVEAVTVERDPRTAEGQHDPAWLRHWE
ncbi:MAG: hypothetical protein H6P99_514 [Holophagaceae bacterium]|nr:hypothetical protein [Holophagaceae bacterium]